MTNIAIVTDTTSGLTPGEARDLGVELLPMPVTINGQEYLSVEELQQACGVSSAVMENLKNVGALGSLPDTSQVSFF